MIVRAGMVAAAMLSATPAAAAVIIGTQIVDTRLSGTIAGAAADSTGSDARVGAGTINARAQLVDPAAGGPALRASSLVTAELAGTQRGRVTFRRTLSPGAGDAVASSAANYRYLFTTDSPVAFDVNWGVATFGAGAGGKAPLQSLILTSRTDGVPVLRLDDLGDGASGADRLTLAPGSYELRISDVFAPVAAAGASSGVSSQYSFALRVVPEPATWTMLIVGFGATGATLRRARRGQTKPRSRGGRRSSST